MKKFATYIIAFALIIQTAFAAMQTTPTDIRVFIDGKEMPAVCRTIQCILLRTI